MTISLDRQNIEFVCELVRQRSAIVIDPAKTYLLESRLMPLARRKGLASVDVLVGVLKQGSPDLTREVVDAMTTNETSFFRDLHPFDALRSQVIPRLIQIRKSEQSLNIWSNACSSGQEIFSIAMLLREGFPGLANWKVKLLATDLCSTILDKAKSGVFNQTETNRGLPMPLMIKYFQREGINFRLKPEILRMVNFEMLNLIEPFPKMPLMDVVFLRNVLIYFSPETKTQILKKIHQALRPDGYLFLGGAETTINLNVPFERVAVGNAVAYQPAK